jgi:hypothetical protein
MDTGPRNDAGPHPRDAGGGGLHGLSREDGTRQIRIR